MSSSDEGSSHLRYFDTPTSSHLHRPLNSLGQAFLKRTSIPFTPHSEEHEHEPDHKNVPRCQPLPPDALTKAEAKATEPINTNTRKTNTPPKTGTRKTNTPKTNARKSTSSTEPRRCIACEVDIPLLWPTTIVLFAMWSASGEYFLDIKQQIPATPAYLITFYKTVSSTVLFLLWIISAICTFMFTLTYLDRVDRVDIIVIDEEKQPGTNYVYPHCYFLFHILLTITPYLRTYIPLLASYAVSYLACLISHTTSYLSFVWRHGRHQTAEARLRALDSLDCGAVVLLAAKYPDVFVCPYLSWVNGAYLTYRDWQR
ncbi:hypothetical protein GE09DRAFT_1218446 [Coniochaeta sp. 2T2.1]|nr:hypothetical protein GE09DRAFT_1218446 [Coniochaeta sp. 2T2.1]